MKKCPRKRKAPSKFVSEVHIRDQSTRGKQKSKRKSIGTKKRVKTCRKSAKVVAKSAQCVKKQQQAFLNFFKAPPKPPPSVDHRCTKTAEKKKVKSTFFRRLRSKAPIYELIDQIWQNHRVNLKFVDEDRFGCKCGATFSTKSYRRKNFELHLQRDKRLGKQSFSPSAFQESVKQSLAKPVVDLKPQPQPQPQQPSLPYHNVCQGYYLRSVDGVDITDKYCVEVQGRNGFYGMPNHRSYLGGGLRGTYKSNMCLISGVCV